MRAEQRGNAVAANFGELQRHGSAGEHALAREAEK
jgi:hypothetical protein